MALNESQDYRLLRELQAPAISIRCGLERIDHLIWLGCLLSWIWFNWIPFNLPNGISKLLIPLSEINEILLEHLLDISSSQVTELKLPLLFDLQVFSINRNEFRL